VFVEANAEPWALQIELLDYDGREYNITFNSTETNKLLVPGDQLGKEGAHCYLGLFRHKQD
jgi:hypothetical protein